MLLTIIPILVFVASVFLVFIFDDIFPPIDPQPVVIILCLSFIFSGVAICRVVNVQITKQSEYEKALMRRDMLEYRLEHKEELYTGNELLYSDILEFNRQLYSVKKWSANPWTSWFWNGI